MLICLKYFKGVKMINQILLTGLLVSGLFIELQAAPTIDQTMNFIQKIIKSDEFSSEIIGDKVHRKPSFSKQSECKYSVVKGWSIKRGAGRPVMTIDGERIGVVKYRAEFVIDFSKQEAKYSEEDEYSYAGIKIKDKQGISSIHGLIEAKDIYKKWYDESMKLSYFSVNIIVNGIYKEKMDKALKHMSKICYEKYGVKNDDLF